MKIFLLGFICLASSGCATYHTASRLSEEEKATLAGAGLANLVVGVVISQKAVETCTREDLPHLEQSPQGEWEVSDSVDEMVEILKRLNLFREVGRPADLAAHPDLLVRVKCPNRRSIYCTPGLDAMTLLTLGVTPCPYLRDRSLDFEFTGVSGDDAVPSVTSEE